MIKRKKILKELEDMEDFLFEDELDLDDDLYVAS